MIFCGGNVALNALNWFWFSKIFAKMLARLSGDAPSSQTAVARGEKQPLLEKAQNGGKGTTTKLTNGSREKDGMVLATEALPVDPPLPVPFDVEG